MADIIDVPVLIVGAGPVGLTLALALERLGIRSLIVEQHHKVSPHPRARFVNARTMEIFRQLGIEPAVRAQAIPDGLASTVIWAPTLSAPEIRQVEIETLGPHSGEPFSPAPGLCTSQDLLDSVLHQAVLAGGRSEVRFGCRLVGLEQDRSGVKATCLDDGGSSSTVRAQYLVGGDGSRSTVRDLCGIAMQGPAALGHTINIHFRADLTPHLHGRPVNLAMIMNPAQPGLLLNIDGRQTWTAQAIFSPAAGQSPEEFDEDRCRMVVRAQVGDSDLDVQILGIAPWTSAARVAERFADGRVYLVGDSAQEMPPAGGFGMNVGIQEAHNLAWKLAAVVGGWARPNLLNTYGEERQPLGRWITEQALLNLQSVGRVESPDGSPQQVRLGRPEFFRERGMVFGAAYTSAAVIPDGTERPLVANAVTDYVPSATPGCRAPHVWIDLDGKRTSTLDLMGDGFVLIDTGSDPSESSRVEQIAADGRVPFRTAVCSDPALAQAYGLAPGGMALIRPDGHVGWRTAHGAASSAEILAALDSLLSRSDLESAAQPDRAETLAR
jgi:putative polyketide hydroxylase